MKTREVGAQGPLTESAAAAATGPAASGIGVLNLAWADAFVAALRDGGVTDVVVAPGSRSAPLVLAADRHGLRAHVALDERAGGYFALGLAKASRRPVAIITTSGTAPANLHPAVLEAHHARVPLVVLSGDRPPELRDTGAAQTVDQIQLFGGATRWFHEVGAPTTDVDGAVYAGSLGSRAAAAAWGPPAGPVHVNFAFREPLIPEPEVAERPRLTREDRASGPGAAKCGPRVVEPDSDAIDRVAKAIGTRRRGLIVCGPEDASQDLAPALARLAAVTGYPVLADPASQLRYGPHDRTRVLGAYDGFLRANGARSAAPEVVLHFGAAPTSKALHQYLAMHPGSLRILVDPAGGWRDPSRRARISVAAEPALFAARLEESLSRAGGGALSQSPEWGEFFARGERMARAAIEEHCAAEGARTEGTIFPALLEAAPEGTLLYVGNSMAIRDLDLHAPGSPRAVRVLANRGVNGIDGVLSSALGASVAGQAPTLLVLGDLSFHHDLNGLAALREGRARATIVIVNNDGGGIFSFLPTSRHESVFERFFGTPHGIDVERAAGLYGIPYVRPRTDAELSDRVATSLQSGDTTIVEIRSDRTENVARHRRLTGRIVDAVEGLP